MPTRRPLLVALVAAVLTLGVIAAAPSSAAPSKAAPSSAAPSNAAAADLAHGRKTGAEHSLRSAATSENFYFVMADRFANGSTANDTGGLGADPMVSGFDPTRTGFYNGGDLKGLHDNLDYIEGLGTTAIWLTPSFKNKAVQPADNSAGYHGYWVTDFTQIDPHLGTNAELKALIDDAHARGMKVYFDIITNHTADVIGYETTGADGQTTFSQRLPYVSKDEKPYRTAAGQPFDDRDHAGTGSFPELSAQTSFPYTPRVAPDEADVKVPAWLNDPTLYHNRGDTTFVGEDSQYGDFYGLDDLFTENPRVVDGFVDVYQTWIGDYGIDGFRIDTMKHVDDAFWQRFGPEVLQYAHQQGKTEFFMFGEVFDTSRPVTSHYTTAAGVQAVLDFPFQDAARSYVSKNGSAADLSTFFTADDWYTDADSNAYQLPTFLGNHDMGRFGWMLQADNPDAADAQLVQRSRLGHELMFFSRGNPVVYYGDEQGFTGSGGDQLARQTMFASQVPQYLDDDLLGTDATHAGDQFNPDHPLYRSIAELSAVTRAHPALRDGAMQLRHAADGPGVLAFSRTRVGEQREYVVAVNNSTSAATATVPTYTARRGFQRIYGDAPDRLTTDRRANLTVTVPALSSVVYAQDGTIPASRTAPAVTLARPAPAAEDPTRMHLTASVRGSSLYEVTFQARTPGGRWQNIGTDDNAPYQVFHDTSARRAGERLQYRAVVLDNAGHTRTSGVRQATVPQATVTVTTPAAGTKVRGSVTVQAGVTPEKASNVVELQRRVGSGNWQSVGTDSSSPVYTAVDDVSALAAGTAVAYRARLLDRGRPVATSAPVQVTVAGPAATQATVHYKRPAGDYDGWGLHLWGSGIDPALLAGISWDRPMPPTRIVDGWAEYDIPLTDDTAAVNFILHTPGGDVVPTSREPGGDRAFTPLDGTDIYLVQGDPTVHTSRP